VSSAHHSKTLKLTPNPSDHSLGPEHAPITIVEYGDFECPSCRVAAPTPALLQERYPHRIRFIYRHFPLEEAHPHALAAAESSEAAAAQGKFWAMHDVLFRQQAHLKEQDLAHYAAEIGLDIVRYRAEMADHIYLQKVREQAAGGRSSHLRATPSFFLNGVLQDVSFGMDALHDAVAALVDGDRS
jgi:protein-disulfide isomerase